MEALPLDWLCVQRDRTPRFHQLCDLLLLLFGRLWLSTGSRGKTKLDRVDDVAPFWILDRSVPSPAGPAPITRAGVIVVMTPRLTTQRDKHNTA